MSTKVVSTKKSNSAAKPRVAAKKAKNTDAIVPESIKESSSPPKEVCQATPVAAVCSTTVCSIVPPTEESATENKKKKRQVDQESVLSTLISLISINREEIENVKLTADSSNKKSVVKSLKQNVNQLEQLKKDVTRVFKAKPKIKRQNVRSGFCIPLNVSKELSTFLGSDPAELHTRMDINKKICKYIKDNNLQNPKDRRQILPDKRLDTVLRTNPLYVENKHPLTYFLLMRFIQNNFIKN